MANTSRTSLTISSIVYFSMFSFAIVLIGFFALLTGNSIAKSFLEFLTPNPEQNLMVSVGLIAFGMLLFMGFLIGSLLRYLKKPHAYAISFYRFLFYSTPLLGFFLGHAVISVIFYSERILFTIVLAIVLALFLFRMNLFHSYLVTESKIPIFSRLDGLRSHWTYFLLVFAWLSGQITIMISVGNKGILVFTILLLFVNILFFFHLIKLEDLFARYFFWMEVFAIMILAFDLIVKEIIGNSLVFGNNPTLFCLGVASLVAYAQSKNVLFLCRKQIEKICIVPGTMRKVFFSGENAIDEMNNMYLGQMNDSLVFLLAYRVSSHPILIDIQQFLELKEKIEMQEGFKAEKLVAVAMKFPDEVLQFATSKGIIVLECKK